MEQALTTAKRWLEAARQRDAAYANRKRKDASYEVGDQVLLSTKNLRLKASGTRKLLPRYIGPFAATKVVNAVAYELHLPATLQCHNVFHVGLLRRYNPSAEAQMPPMPEVIDGEPEFEVEKILEHRQRGKGRHRQTWYLLRWKGYSTDYDTWEPDTNLTSCRELLQEYWKTKDPSPGGKDAVKTTRPHLRE